MTRKEQQPHATEEKEAGEVRRAPPFGALSKPGGINPDDVDAAPLLARRKARLGMLIGPAAADDRDFMTALPQSRRQVGQMLSRRDDVGKKHLIKKQNFQGKQPRSSFQPHNYRPSPRAEPAPDWPGEGTGPTESVIALEIIQAACSHTAFPDYINRLSKAGGIIKLSYYDNNLCSDNSNNSHRRWHGPS